MEVILVLIGLCAGLIIGWRVSKKVTAEKPIGTLRIDNSDPEDGPYLFLELTPTADINYIKTKKHVTMQVRVKNYISHD